MTSERIPLRRVSAHLVLEDRLTLIDCGYAGSAGRIAKAIEGHGRSVAEVDRLICTHGHPDHAGSARELAAMGVPVLIHPADAAGLKTRWRDALARPSRGRVFAAMTPDVPQTEPLFDGQIIPALGGLEVIHTPGHTPGSVCLYGARDGVLFVGDTLRGAASGVSRLASSALQRRHRPPPAARCNDSRRWTSGQSSSVTTRRVEERAADVLAALAARA